MIQRPEVTYEKGFRGRCEMQLRTAVLLCFQVWHCLLRVTSKNHCSKLRFVTDARVKLNAFGKGSKLSYCVCANPAVHAAHSHYTHLVGVCTTRAVFLDAAAYLGSPHLKHTPLLAKFDAPQAVQSQSPVAKFPKV